MVGATLFQKVTPGHREQCHGGNSTHPEVTSQDVNPDIWVMKGEREDNGALLLGNEEEDANTEEEQESGTPNTRNQEIPPSMMIPAKASSRKEQTDARASHILGGMWLTQVLHRKIALKRKNE
ncbi:hypothetical protein NDU88_001250 [Pleurodeles waltl]|uniref:Uncharacterized protein n=1 Tax=Pleurodeles waltl TaxID=8319 RepID=A0AAV7L913_PLEWA|nr:hypothetical protein NDU88_001250 [Pleurodeles waltl]